MAVIKAPGTGFDRRTGKVLSGWSHVVQSLDTLWSTQFGERVMREDYSGIVPHMLGRNMIPATVLRFKMAIWLATELWEPRFKITSITPLDVNRNGHLRLAVDGIYRPRAHLGDFTPEGGQRLIFGPTSDLTYRASAT